MNTKRPPSAGDALDDTPDSFSLKPQLYEHHGKDDQAGGGGLRGPDHQQGDLVDSAPRGSAKGTPARERESRTPHENAQPGADVRAPCTHVTDTLPEGLIRERTHPLGPTTGRSGGVPAHVPSSKPK